GSVEGVVRGVDVGAVKAVFDEDAPPFDLTGPGEMLGEVEYMAPEQARAAQSSDVRADLYSVGCVLYHMLSGQPPFADASRVRQLLRHATEAPAPLARAGVAGPAGLEEAPSVLLRKSPPPPHPTPPHAADAPAASP